MYPFNNAPNRKTKGKNKSKSPTKAILKTTLAMYVPDSSTFNLLKPLCEEIANFLR